MPGVLRDYTQQPPQLKRIVIEFIPYKDQRYKTLGDYYYDLNGDLKILVSDSGDEYMNRLIALHEIIEEALTKKLGISEPDILSFDLKCKDEDPGWNKCAPYHKQHIFSEIIERAVCNELGIDWLDYEKKLNKIK